MENVFGIASAGKGKVVAINFNDDIFDDEVQLLLGKNYEIKVEGYRTCVVRKKTVYPKTYVECEKILGLEDSIIEGCLGYEYKLLNAFQKLLMCRDAYWKIASNWKPDWNNISDKYTIYPVSGEIWLDKGQTINTVLAFPTKEMRDSFYENFIDLIEQCKDFL